MSSLIEIFNLFKELAMEYGLWDVAWVAAFLIGVWRLPVLLVVIKDWCLRHK